MCKCLADELQLLLCFVSMYIFVFALIFMLIHGTSYVLISLFCIPLLVQINMYPKFSHPSWIVLVIMYLTISVILNEKPPLY